MRKTAKAKAAKAAPQPPKPKPKPPAELRVALVTALGNHPVVLDELAARGIAVGSAKALHTRGQTAVLVTVTKQALHDLFTLRTVEDILLVMYEALPMASPADLTRIEPGRFKRALAPAAAILRLDPRRGAFAVFVKQDEDRALHRKQIADAIAATARAVNPGWRPHDPAAIEFWAFFESNRLTVGIRLTDLAFRQRDWRDKERPGSLRPTLAASLIALSEPLADEVFLDPMCGSGTIAIERGLWGPAAALHAADNDEMAVRLARRNAEKAGVAVTIRRADATRPEAHAELLGQVDRLVCNPPFGVQHGKGADLAALYKAALVAWAPLLSPRGRMVMLTPRADDLRAAARAAGLTARPLHRLFIQGIWAEVFALEAYS